MKNNKTVWIQHDHFFRDNEYECSSCGYISDRPHPVCPGCGKKMNGSEYDPSFIDELEEMEMILED